eukprot:CAMPEP_0202865854 /NCGR_PEP_ID=MMETSP1391-20130828/6554_1 /ASSEMBLY_ACC=CAM_ASM_000867 /TAXON_ID=1034604 /ORGANISM="Chlamydomonas leiostraca, Strain SAG 11-49" /LENGTH=299 /DNA_ID=CAMNT_0049545737 /DNA_START=42 /DNA_END=944 /DNA_ORIENTATION=+
MQALAARCAAPRLISASRSSKAVSVRAMSSKSVICTDRAPAALGPYSQAIKAGNTVYVSGQIGIVPGTKDFASPDVEGQTEQVLKNMGAILDAAGANYKNVVKTTILLADIGDFAKVNAIYAKYFTEQPPARATYAVKDLPLGARVEIEAIAVLRSQISDLTPDQIRARTSPLICVIRSRRVLAEHVHPGEGCGAAAVGGRAFGVEAGEAGMQQPAQGQVSIGGSGGGTVQTAELHGVLHLEPLGQWGCRRLKDSNLAEGCCSGEVQGDAAEPLSQQGFVELPSYGMQWRSWLGAPVDT